MSNLESPGFARGPLPILVAAVLWGSTGTVSSFAPALAPASAVGAAGLVLGGVLLFSTARGARSLFRVGTHWQVALGIAGVAGYVLAFYPAVARTGVAVATAVALGSAPVFTGLLAWLTGQGRPTARWLTATALAVSGCTVLVLGGHGETARADLLGVALAAFAGLSYATYSLVCGHLIGRGHRSRAVVGALFGGAALLTLPVLIASGTRWLGTVPGAVVVLHLALCTTFLAYLLFGHGLRHTSAAAATTLTLVEPAVAAVLGVVVLRERLSVESWWGLGVLAIALVLLSAPVRDRTNPRR